MTKRHATIRPTQLAAEMPNTNTILLPPPSPLQAGGRGLIVAETRTACVLACLHYALYIILSNKQRTRRYRCVVVLNKDHTQCGISMHLAKIARNP